MSLETKDHVLDTLEPQVRLKQLIDYSNQVEAGSHVPPLRYYRSGQEMVRMANVYFKEGSLENAYVLYLKFMTLFLEKIRKHPEFSTVAVEVKAKNQATLREVLPKAEKIKQLLLEQYSTDYKRCAAERKKLEQEKKKPPVDHTIINKGPKPPSVPSTKVTSVIKIPESLDNVAYPDTDLQSLPVVPPPSAITVQPKPKPPTIDRTNKPSDIFAQGRYDTNVLRPVVVPIQVMTLFQAMAQSNTFKNIETCGVLCGKLERNELIITHMILPKQKGTSDSCNTTNEEEIFEYQDLHNLITIGWIHTHPTQTAFLSSVDLHTHCPYQLLMPEAIAIVCSPKYNETGIFILTPNHGLHFIANCRQEGFHPHPTDPPLFVVLVPTDKDTYFEYFDLTALFTFKVEIFKEADHVRIDNNAPVEVRDLRKM